MSKPRIIEDILPVFPEEREPIDSSECDHEEVATLDGGYYGYVCRRCKIWGRSPADFQRKMAATFECSVCGREIGYGPGGLGLAVHSRKHKESFAEAHDRWPSNYQEVRNWFNQNNGKNE